jgi:hypothetical protein
MHVVNTKAHVYCKNSRLQYLNRTLFVWSHKMGMQTYLCDNFFITVQTVCFFVVVDLHQKQHMHCGGVKR